MPTREEMWRALGGERDVLVIGGGINGAAIARDAVRRGLTVALVEMDDLASGTSSRSSKLVHGGVRYLEQYQFGLVFESVSERRILMDLAPHLVNPLGFLFPVYAGTKHKRWVLNTGMWIYDGLSLFRSPRMHKNLDPDEVAMFEPAVRQEGLKGAPLYWDCATNDARLTLETALDAARAGATVVTYAAVTALLREGGRVVGATVRDVRSGETREVRARVVVNATGPWTDRTLALGGSARPKPLLRPTKGVHLVVDHRKLPLRHAVVCMHPKDKRLLFAIPWGDATYLGTTDTDFTGDPAAVHATGADVDYLLEAANALFPERPLARGDVRSTWAGVRALIAPEGGGGKVHESEVSREHEILVDADGLVTVAGGKLTTHRRMAEEVVDKAVRWLELGGALRRELKAPRTHKEPLPGAIGWPDDDDHEAVAARVREETRNRVSGETALLLTNTYGMRAFELAARIRADAALAAPLSPGRPEILAQVDFAAEEELAASLVDVMVRRTELFYRAEDQGLAASAPVAERLAARLGWDAPRVAAEQRAYAETVALSRRWRDA